VDAAKRPNNGGGKESIVANVRSDINNNVAGLQKALEDFASERLVVQEIEVAEVDGLQFLGDVQTIGCAVHGEAIDLEQVGGNGTSQPVFMERRKGAADGLRKGGAEKRGIYLRDSRE
jgi:hypothetical protein